MKKKENNNKFNQKKCDVLVHLDLKQHFVTLLAFLDASCI